MIGGANSIRHPGRRQLQIAVPALLIMAASLWAADVPRLSVTHQDKQFTLYSEMHINAPSSAVFRVLSDYDHWNRLSPLIKESKVVSSPNERRHRVRSLTRACILFFCTDVVQIQEIAEIEDREIVARTLPQESNLQQGEVDWRLEQEGGQTRATLFARLTPDFWIPPLIGPWTIKYRIRTAVVEIAKNLERLAQQSLVSGDGLSGSKGSASDNSKAEGVPGAASDFRTAAPAHPENRQNATEKSPPRGIGPFGPPHGLRPEPATSNCPQISPNFVKPNRPA